MTDNISILILTHGNFGIELINSAQMIYGATENICSVPLLQGMSFEEYLEEVLNRLNHLSGKTIILTDLYGGTPNNIAMMIQAERNLDVFCGINLPILIELISLRENELNFDELESRLLETGRNSIKKIVPKTSKDSIF